MGTAQRCDLCERSWGGGRGKGWGTRAGSHTCFAQESDDDEDVATRANELAAAASVGRHSTHPAPAEASGSLDERSDTIEDLCAKVHALVSHCTSGFLSCQSDLHWQETAATICRIATLLIPRWPAVVGIGAVAAPCEPAPCFDAASMPAGPFAAALASCWPHLLHVIRDRCLSHPTSVPTLLPVVASFCRELVSTSGGRAVRLKPHPAHITGAVSPSLKSAVAAAVTMSHNATKAGLTGINTAVNRVVMRCLASLCMAPAVVQCAPAREALFMCLFSMVQPVVSPWLVSLCRDLATADLSNSVTRDRYTRSVA